MGTRRLLLALLGSRTVLPREDSVWMSGSRAPPFRGPGLAVGRQHRCGMWWCVNARPTLSGMPPWRLPEVGSTQFPANAITLTRLCSLQAQNGQLHKLFLATKNLMRFCL